VSKPRLGIASSQGVVVFWVVVLRGGVIHADRNAGVAPGRVLLGVLGLRLLRLVDLLLLETADSRLGQESGSGREAKT